MKDTLVVKKATPLGARVWTSLLVFGFIGQIAWMVENVYFSTYIQKNITAAGWATSATVAASAIAAALATIFSAAWSDRVGKRRAGATSSGASRRRRSRSSATGRSAAASVSR